MAGLKSIYDEWILPKINDSTPERNDNSGFYFHGSYNNVNGRKSSSSLLKLQKIYHPQFILEYLEIPIGMLNLLLIVIACSSWNLKKSKLFWILYGEIGDLPPKIHTLIPIEIPIGMLNLLLIVIACSSWNLKSKLFWNRRFTT